MAKRSKKHIGNHTAQKSVEQTEQSSKKPDMQPSDFAFGSAEAQASRLKDVKADRRAAATIQVSFDTPENGSRADGQPLPSENANAETVAGTAADKHDAEDKSYRTDKSASPELKEYRLAWRFKESDLAPDSATGIADDAAANRPDKVPSGQEIGLGASSITTTGNMSEGKVTTGPHGESSFVMRESEDAAHAPLVPRGERAPVSCDGIKDDDGVSASAAVPPQENSAPAHDAERLVIKARSRNVRDGAEEEVEVDFSAHLAPEKTTEKGGHPGGLSTDAESTGMQAAGNAKAALMPDSDKASARSDTAAAGGTESMGTVFPGAEARAAALFDGVPSGRDEHRKNDEPTDVGGIKSSPAGEKTDAAKPAKSVAKPAKIVEPLPVFAPLAVERSEAPTMASRFYGAAALLPIVFVTILYLVQVFPVLEGCRLLWVGEESRLGALFQSVLNGHGLMPLLNGELYVGGPLYVWFLHGLREVLLAFSVTSGMGGQMEHVILLGSAVSGLLLLWGVLALARYVAGMDRKGSLAAGCVLLSITSFWWLAHVGGDNVFFAAIVVFAWLFLFRGVLRRRDTMRMGIGFFFTALAVLSQGLIGFLLPVLGTLLFCIWSGRFLRVLRKDFLLGALFSLLPCIIWLGALWADGHTEFVGVFLLAQVAHMPFVQSPDTWWLALATLPLLCLPWVALVLFIPWHRALASSTRTAFKQSFRGDHQGLAFIWLSVAASIVGIAALRGHESSLMLPAVALMSIPAGRIVLQLSTLRNSLLQKLFAVLCLPIAAALVLVPMYMKGDASSLLGWMEYLLLPKWNIEVAGCFILAAVLLAGFCLFIGTLNARRPEGTLLVMVLLATLCAYPFARWTMPSLDPVMSPKAGADMLAPYVEQGYAPLGYKIPQGAFAYYLSAPVEEITLQSRLLTALQEKPKAALTMPEREWKGWYYASEMREAGTFWMGGARYVIALQNSGGPKPERDLFKDLFLHQTREPGNPAERLEDEGIGAPQSGTENELPRGTLSAPAVPSMQDGTGLNENAPDTPQSPALAEPNKEPAAAMKDSASLPAIPYEGNDKPTSATEPQDSSTTDTEKTPQMDDSAASQEDSGAVAKGHTDEEMPKGAVQPSDDASAGQQQQFHVPEESANTPSMYHKSGD